MTTDDRRALFVAHHAELRRFVRRLVASEDDADDLLHDMAVVLFGHRSGPPDAGSFSFWCRAVARYLAAHRRRAYARREVNLAAWAATGTIGEDLACDSPERVATAREQVTAHLDVLDESARTLFLALFVEGQTPTEIASRCMVSPASVRMRLMRLRSALRAGADSREPNES